MRWMLVLLAVGCGGAEASDRTGDAVAVSCDWCPGNADFRTYDAGGITMAVCPCPSDPKSSSMVFRIDPPLATCANTQCMYAHYVAGGCVLGSPSLCP